MRIERVPLESTLEELVGLETRRRHGCGPFKARGGLRVMRPSKRRAGSRRGGQGARKVVGATGARSGSSKAGVLQPSCRLSHARGEKRIPPVLKMDYWIY